MRVYDINMQCGLHMFFISLFNVQVLCRCFIYLTVIDVATFLAT